MRARLHREHEHVSAARTDFRNPGDWSAQRGSAEPESSLVRRSTDLEPAIGGGRGKQRRRERSGGSERETERICAGGWALEGVRSQGTGARTGAHTSFCVRVFFVCTNVAWENIQCDTVVKCCFPLLTHHMWMICTELTHLHHRHLSGDRGFRQRVMIRRKTNIGN